ncbi:MAG: nucleotide exchange factor GrpE [Candidatus Muirbacterium halophilum]|nr:nucleotide exchange factor GrpE [Candidatus Muirbacterium halophilum]MCK9474727.1 nucleotide exchange factor GrpE [Candidatus Muirbacterium halophilum]
MTNEHDFTKIEKYRKKLKNLEKIVDEIFLEQDYKDETKELKKQLVEFGANFEITEDIINEYLSLEKDEKSKEKDLDNHGFFKFIILKQFNFFKKIIETQNYYKNLEENSENLKKENIRLESQLKEYIDLSSRLKKDYENLSKRTEKEKVVLEQNASKKICLSMIEILDNFMLALNSFRQADSNTLEKDKVLLGLDKIEKKISDILLKEGVFSIDSINNSFDHNFHEAIATEERDDIEEDNLITEEFRKGYMFKEEVLRPSLVKVAKKIESSENKN